MVLQVILGTNDDDEYSMRVIQRVAKRQGARDHAPTSRDHLPRDRRPRAAGAARRDARRQRAEHGPLDRPRTATGWPSGRPTSPRRPGASQAGILLGSNEDIPAFRWVEKERGRMMVCSSPADCAEIERRHSTGDGLLADGGASRGNLLSGEAEEAILTVSRTDAEKRRQPRLPRVLRQRLQRHAARWCCSSGR